MKPIRFVLAAAGLLAVAACGNKGPLMLPQKPAPVETPEPAPQAETPVEAPPVKKPVDDARR